MKDVIAASKEAMLHLPMEPYNSSYVQNNGNMVLISMLNNEIEHIVIKNLNSLPDVVGVNNHMGSKATSDDRVMFAVLSAVKSKGLFFIDSRTSIKSVAYDMAKQQHIKTAKNEIFLDTDKTEEKIQMRLRQLINLAKNKGFAVGIGHVTRPTTIKVLKKMMPVYEEQGINFVFASSIVK